MARGLGRRLLLHVCLRNRSVIGSHAARVYVLSVFFGTIMMSRVMSVLNNGSDDRCMAGGIWLAGAIVLGSMMGGVGQYVTEMFEDSFQIQGMAEVGILHILAQRTRAPNFVCIERVLRPCIPKRSTAHAPALSSHRRTWLPHSWHIDTRVAALLSTPSCSTWC